MSKTEQHIRVHLANPTPDWARSLRDPRLGRAYAELRAVLDSPGVGATRRQVPSVSPARIREIEAAVRSSWPAGRKSPVERFGSTTGHWNIDATRVDRPEDLVLGLRELPGGGVMMAYLDRGRSPALGPVPDLGKEQSDCHGLLGVERTWKKFKDLGLHPGQGVQLVDVEFDWDQEHPDLPGTARICGNLIDGRVHEGKRGWQDHGTGVLGLIAARHEPAEPVQQGEEPKLPEGITGIAYGLETPVMLASIHNKHCDLDQDGVEDGCSTGDVEAAIWAAIDSLPNEQHPENCKIKRGSVLLLEVAAGKPHDQLPTEIYAGDFEAIQIATNRGLVVVEAAGNAGLRLDDWKGPVGFSYPGKKIFSKELFADQEEPIHSGAIIVGACDGTADNSWGDSNYGSRVDCCAPGEGLVTTGGGTLDLGSGDYPKYFRSFGGTSGAAALVAGAAVCIQSYYQKVRGQTLTSAEMADFLRIAGTEIPDADDAQLGIVPNIGRILDTID